MDKNSPKGKGFRTAYQAIAGTVLAYFTGLFALPAVREYTTGFIQTQGIPALLVVLTAFGIGAGAVSFFQNKFGK